MKPDSELKRDVEAELGWDPEIDATDIAVNVKNGVVSLTGFVRSYQQKIEAETIAKRLAGVHAVANDIELRLPSFDERPDPEIAREAVTAIRTQVPTASENIKIVVKAGWIYLEGDVDWHFTRQLAETAVRRIKGVRGVANDIKLNTRIEPRDVKRGITAAFHRSAQIDAQCIDVETMGGSVTLKGVVKSWAERNEAQRAAWAARGVTNVDNQIVVRS
jgi:osmotically-inducible protein OsmY